MAYKPVHLITNDDLLHLGLALAEIEYEIGSEDYTEAEGLHYHYLLRWDVNEVTRTLSPTRRGAVQTFRNNGVKLGRCKNGCKNKQFNYPCPECGTFYKFIWCQTPEHTNNVRAYIQKKIDEHPDWALDYPQN